MANPNEEERDDISFNIINEDVVDRLRRDKKVILPRKDLNVPKDRRWNEKQMAAMLLKGIENGDNIKKISWSIFPEIMSKTSLIGKSEQEIYGKGGIIDKNKESAIRNARTMFTSAENHGRLDSFKSLTSQGVVMKKEWEATPDERTRKSHMDMDGEEQDIDAVFSNGCRFPGDGDGPPDEVWNCRCAMGSHIVGFLRSDGSISYVNYDRDETTHEEQMAEERERRESKRGANNSLDERSYSDKIKEIAMLASKNGISTEYIMQAGKIFAEEIESALYDRREQFRIAKENMDKAGAEELRRITDEKYNEASLINRALINIEESKYWNDELKAWEYWKSVSERRDEILKSDEYKEAYYALKEAKKILKGTADENAKLLRDKLSAIREVGISDLNIKEHLNNSRSPMYKHVEWAYNQYPTSWIQKSIDHGNLSVKKVDRGYYSEDDKVIAISFHGEDGAKATAIHELSHRFERCITTVKDQEKEFYERRTSGQALEWLGEGYSKGEKTRKDDFISPYMGKDYGGSAYELMSMGAQYAYTDPVKLSEDKDMQAWIYGLLSIGD